MKISATVLALSAASATFALPHSHHQNKLESRGFLKDRAVPWLCSTRVFNWLSYCQNVNAIKSNHQNAGTITIDTPLGKIIGKSDGNTNRFSVRYAQSPVGDLRFADPVAVTAWKDEFNATALPPFCPQDLNPAMNSDNEDCLFLNVYAPRNINAQQKLPVFVWVHGGSFVYGSSTASGLDGSILANKGNMIVVTVQYRLGMLGFLSAPEFGLTGNYGVKDVVAALGYVKNNIAAFGGDQTRVTLAGHSSGASLVSSLLSTPSAADLFHRAILHSPPLMYGDHTPSISTGLGEIFIDALECNEGGLACLRAANVSSVIQASDATYFEAPKAVPGAGPGQPIMPVVDGQFIKSSFHDGSKGLKGGLIAHNKNIIITTVKNEAAKTISMVSPELIPAEQYEPYVVNVFPDRGEDILDSELYELNEKEADAVRESLETIGTDELWRCPAQQYAVNMTSTQQAPAVYLAEFDHGIQYPSNADNAFCFGKTVHEDDIYAVFNTGSDLSPAQDSLQSEVLARWAAFAAFGSPNINGYQQWSKIESGDKLNLLKFKEDGKSATVQEQRVKECKVGSGLWGNKILFDSQIYN